MTFFPVIFARRRNCTLIRIPASFIECVIAAFQTHKNTKLNRNLDRRKVTDFIKRARAFGVHVYSLLRLDWRGDWLTCSTPPKSTFIIRRKYLQTNICPQLKAKSRVDQWDKVFKQIKSVTIKLKHEVQKLINIFN